MGSPAPPSPNSSREHDGHRDCQEELPIRSRPEDAGRRVLLLLPGFGLYLLIAFGPSLATAVYSFTDASGIRGAAVNWIGFENYDEFLFRGLASRDNLAALQRTLIFMVVVTTVQFSLGLVLALLLNQKLKGRTFFRTLFFLPVILGVVIQGLMWKLFLFPGGGPVAEVFGWFGIQSEFLGGAPTEAFIWVMVVQIWANVGITMVIFLGRHADDRRNPVRSGPDRRCRRLAALQETSPGPN